MPVWGLIFKDEEPIRQIVAYLRNLQPTYGTSLSGATLFQTHCASCHGVNGQGNGELVSVLRTLPADLTQLTRKNKGVFPETTLTGLIDGKHDVLAHGPRAMPVWGLIFQNAETIHKLVEHVRNLQAK
jgi:mono/diheme cytochrome c family protein